MGKASQYLGFNKNSAYLIFNLLELYFKQIRMSEASKWAKRANERSEQMSEASKRREASKMSEASQMSEASKVRKVSKMSKYLIKITWTNGMD